MAPRLPSAPKLCWPGRKRCFSMSHTMCRRRESACQCVVYQHSFTNQTNKASRNFTCALQKPPFLRPASSKPQTLSPEFCTNSTSHASPATLWAWCRRRKSSRRSKMLSFGKAERPSTRSSAPLSNEARNWLQQPRARLPQDPCAQPPRLAHPPPPCGGRSARPVIPRPPHLGIR